MRSWNGQAGKWTVSTEGGRGPRWSREGSEIFYVDLDQRLMTAALSFDGEEQFRSATPEALFDIGTADYEPAADGQRFLVMKVEEGSEPMTAIVVLNWPQLLEDDD